MCVFWLFDILNYYILYVILNFKDQVLECLLRFYYVEVFLYFIKLQSIFCVYLIKELLYNVLKEFFD